MPPTPRSARPPGRPPPELARAGLAAGGRHGRPAPGRGRDGPDHRLPPGPAGPARLLAGRRRRPI